MCEESQQACVQVLVQGTPCDDGDQCTTSDVCHDNICTGRCDVGCGDCGNTTIEWGENCDDGDPSFAFEDLCSADCQWIGCGRPTGSAGAFPMAADALYVLRVSVALSYWPLVLCDVNGSGHVEVTDALLVLRSAVGLRTLVCPSAADTGA